MNIFAAISDVLGIFLIVIGLASMIGNLIIEYKDYKRAKALENFYYNNSLRFFTILLCLIYLILKFLS